MSYTPIDGQRQIITGVDRYHCSSSATCYHVQRLKRLLKFFIIGVVFGVTEDVLAVVVATDAEVTLEVIASSS
jgi:hypothetical protein